MNHAKPCEFGANKSRDPENDHLSTYWKNGFRKRWHVFYPFSSIKKKKMFLAKPLSLESIGILEENMAFFFKFEHLTCFPQVFVGYYNLNLQKKNRVNLLSETLTPPKKNKNKWGEGIDLLCNQRVVFNPEHRSRFASCCDPSWPRPHLGGR